MTTMLNRARDGVKLPAKHTRWVYDPFEKVHMYFLEGAYEPMAYVCYHGKGDVTFSAHTKAGERTGGRADSVLAAKALAVKVVQEG